MFNSKKTKSLKAEIRMLDRVIEEQEKMFNERLEAAEKKIAEFPKIKICCECGDVKSKDEFKVGYIPFHGMYYNDYCNSCSSDVKDKKEAAEFANENYEKVLKIKKQSSKTKTRAKK